MKPEQIMKIIDTKIASGQKRIRISKQIAAELVYHDMFEESEKTAVYLKKMVLAGQMTGLTRSFRGKTSEVIW